MNASETRLIHFSWIVSPPETKDCATHACYAEKISGAKGMIAMYLLRFPGVAVFLNSRDERRISGHLHHLDSPFRPEWQCELRVVPPEACLKNLSKFRQFTFLSFLCLQCMCQFVLVHYCHRQKYLDHHSFNGVNKFRPWNTALVHMHFQIIRANCM
jgi:hypothetical protein